MTDIDKVKKFISKLQQLIKQLEDSNMINLHRHVDQFYYMQKSFELQVLCDQAIRSPKQLNFELLEQLYLEVYLRWKQDVRWIHSHTS